MSHSATRGDPHGRRPAILTHADTATLDPTGLASSVRGRVLTPVDEGFADAAAPWNRAVERHPIAVVQVADAGDVVEVVRFAAGAGLAVAVQPRDLVATDEQAAIGLLDDARRDTVDAISQVRQIVYEMRQRATELGGSLSVGPGPHGAESPQSCPCGPEPVRSRRRHALRLARPGRAGRVAVRCGLWAGVWDQGRFRAWPGAQVVGSVEAARNARCSARGRHRQALAQVWR